MDFFWKDIAIADSEEIHRSFEEVEILIRRNADELTIADRQPGEGEFVDEIDWERYVTGSHEIRVRFAPMTPDRPLVVNPEYPVQILPGQSARFFILIPAWIQISIEKNPPVVLKEIPSAILSATWFGGPQDGILSYSLNSPAYRRYNDSPLPKPTALEIISPLTVKNHSQELLSLRDLNIHCEHLHVYQGKTLNWTNEVKISFYGGNQPSKVQYVEKRPSFEEMGKEHCVPRVKIRQDILAKSYSFLKNFS